MKAYYDLHIHSCLSPCGDKDMTPNNIVNMAKLSGLNAIALTDHNSCRNCEAVMCAGQEAGILVVPGMELCTAEEAHIICLLPTLEAAMELGRRVYEAMPAIQNRPDVFGKQIVMDSKDRPVDEEQRLLISAADISIEAAARLVRTLGGVCFPAHIDRASYSVLSTLGGIPPEAEFTAAEITAKGDVEALQRAHPALRDMPLLLSSDAHYLGDIADPRGWIDLPALTAQALIGVLRRETKAAWGR